MSRANSCELFRILSWLDPSTDSKAFLVRGTMQWDTQRVISYKLSPSRVISFCANTLNLLNNNCSNKQSATRVIYSCAKTFSRIRLQKVRKAKQIIEDFAKSWISHVKWYHIVRQQRQASDQSLSTMNDLDWAQNFTERLPSPTWLVLNNESAQTKYEVAWEEPVKRGDSGEGDGGGRQGRASLSSSSSSHLHHQHYQNNRPHAITPPWSGRSPQMEGVLLRVLLDEHLVYQPVFGEHCHWESIPWLDRHWGKLSGRTFLRPAQSFWRWVRLVECLEVGIFHIILL